MDDLQMVIATGEALLKSLYALAELLLILVKF